MLVKRLLVIIPLIPLFALLAALGGIPFSALVVLALGIAAWEYWRMFYEGGYFVSRVAVIGGVIAIAINRAIWGFKYSDVVLAVLIMLTMTLHILRYENGRQHAATDFGVTLGGILYLGWLGSYLISLRNLPNGLWWLLLVLPTAWLSDTGGYVFGRRLGKKPLSPRASPNKTWEGYVGGIAFGTLGALLLAALWQLRAPEITFTKALIIGLVISILAPIGDLGESVIKRQFGRKDSSNILPGHGGMMDRIDSWIWAATLGYYLVLWFS